MHKRATMDTLAVLGNRRRMVLFNVGCVNSIMVPRTIAPCLF
ncbi:hypothetical protein O9993_01970 [Vibrio lentus]|nr:hypothetical protein [Vibrio lentus]